VRYDAEGWEGSDLHNYEIVQLPPIQENLIVICSETSRQSEYFVSNIKDTLDTREDLNTLFGIKQPKAFVTAMEEQGFDASHIAKNKWTNDAFITADGTVVVGRGAGQQIRGMNIRGSRPTTIFVDDMYSRNNTRTVTRKEDLNRWFYAELSNSLDGRLGKLFFLGTVVATDTVIDDMQRSDQWFGLSRPIISFEELQDVIQKHCSIDDGEVTIPSSAKCKVIQQSLKTLSWPDKHDLYYILNTYKREYEQGRVAYFYQEYLNITQAPEEAKFDREKLKPVTFTYQDGLMEFDYQGKHWYAQPRTIMAIDLASSDKATADDTVIACCGIYRCKAHNPGTNDIDEMIVPAIVWLDGGRGWGIYNEVRDTFRRRGVIDEIKNILGHVAVDEILIETNAQQEQTRRQLDSDLYNARIHIPVVGKHSEHRKVDRILSILEPIFARFPAVLYERRCGVAVEKFFSQLLMLGPTDTKDDYPDGVSMAFLKAAVNPLDFNIPGITLGSGNVAQLEESYRHRAEKFGISRWEIL
jgi:hypothetical protein